MRCPSTDFILPVNDELAHSVTLGSTMSPTITVVPSEFVDANANAGWKSFE